MCQIEHILHYINDLLLCTIHRVYVYFMYTDDDDDVKSCRQTEQLYI